VAHERANDTLGDAAGTGRSNHPARAVALTCLIGVVLTAVSAWAAYRADEGTEQRLLETQTQQAAAVLSTAIFVVQQPLTTALQVQATAGPDGDTSVFRRAFGVNVGGEEALFVSASLWHREGRTTTRLATLGARPGIAPHGPEIRAFLARAFDSSTSVVDRVEVGDRTRIAFALADPATGLAIYAERALPKDRRSRSDGDSAFARLHYAIYLGDETHLDALTTTDVDPADLPLEDPSEQATVPFGDMELTLVTQPTDHLGSTLSQRLPLILLLGGLLLTGATSLVARRLVGARMRAEADSATITALYGRINGIYEEQRAVFVRLQRALLPRVNPRIPKFEIATKYVAGAEEVEIGGDWYSVIDLDEETFGFVVGDVSGKGVDAVAAMARARFTLRAYLLDGSTPSEALEKCSHQFDIAVDDHIITALVGVGRWRTGEIDVANAGHPLPLLVAADGTRHLSVPVGPPLGVGPSSYESATITMPPGATLIAYTDGLVERRGEDIDVGMQRLADTAHQQRSASVEDLLTSLLDQLRGEGASDDIALLALRRQPAMVPDLG
jgi:serine phosphatase RsbU (regulator of sigma subunit)